MVYIQTVDYGVSNQRPFVYSVRVHQLLQCPMAEANSRQQIIDFFVARNAVFVVT